MAGSYGHPDYQSIMLPLLRLADDGEEHRFRESASLLKNIEAKIVLMDGAQLAQFMFEHNVGVAPASVYEVKKVEMDFFDED